MSIFAQNCYIISLLSFIIYNLYIILKFGVPDCLSKTYYLVGNWFTYWIIFTMLLLFPTLVEISLESYEFLPFLSLVGMIGVGITPRYLEDLQILHKICAYSSFIISIIWSILMNSYYGLLLLPLVLFTKNKLYWIEIIAILNIYLI